MEKKELSSKMDKTSIMRLILSEKQLERLIDEDEISEMMESERQRQERKRGQKTKNLLAKMFNLSLSEVNSIAQTEKKNQKNFKLDKREFPRLSHGPKNACEKYMSNIKLIDGDHLGMESKIKKLKKVIIQHLKNIEDVKVYYSTVYPMLIFSYKEGRSKEVKFKHLREVMKEVPSLRGKVSLFDDIFGRIYDRVDCKYYCLVVFALEKAEQVKMKVEQKDLLNYSEENTVMFYCKKGQNKQLNFMMFDRFLGSKKLICRSDFQFILIFKQIRIQYFYLFLKFIEVVKFLLKFQGRSIEFHSNFIQDKKGQYPVEYSKFQKLYNSLFDETTVDESSDILDREEVESDQDDRPTFQDKSLQSLKQQIEKYLQKDLRGLAAKIEEIEEEIQEEALIDSSSERMNILTEKLEELEENKVNYETVRDKVKSEIKLGNKDKYLTGLKKLIIAQKQMESKLPIIGKKRKIFQMLKKQNLLIIEGETGSGKSTQFPQILCEYYQLFDKPDAKPVLVTQPRKLATRSLAERVAKEMGENVGGFVDYVASAGRTVNPKAKIIFKLDRLVLDELTEDPLLSKYSCLVIDQAHQRTISIDVILGLIKELLEKRKDFKIIVTSASMDIQLFEDYFKTKTLKVSGRVFPVTISYKDYVDFKQGDRYQMVRKIDRVINEQILYDNNSMKIQFKGHLLCFCSGVDEISQLVRIYEAKLNPKVFTVLPLHGKISPEEQRKVFEFTGKHKFIFASRIAQTAITIDGVRVVIDPGQDIQLVYDQKYKISTMKIVDISQSSAKQRAGRSGRTAPGYCFRLYSETNFKQRKVCKMPEMENSSLETVVLRLKSLRINDVLSFPYLSKPSIQGLKNSVELLKLIGGLSGETGKITKIGELLIRIPIDPFLSRAIVEGIIYERILSNEKYERYYKQLPQKQLEELAEKKLVQTITVTLSLLINFSNLFFIKPKERQNGQAVKFTEFSDEEGDFFFLSNIYQKYLSLKSNGKSQSFLKKSPQTKELKEWTRKNYLNSKTLNQSEDLVDEIRRILFSFKINETLYEEQVKKACEKVEKCKSFREMVLSCLITSFSPNLCKYSGNPHIGYTLVNQRRPVQIYGTSNLSLLGIEADWIICYDLYTNEVGRLYCKVAHKVSFEFIQNHTDKFIQEVFNIQKIQQKNPFYEQLHYSLPTTIVKQVKADFSRGQKDEKLQFLQQTNPMINEQTNEITFFILVEESTNADVLRRLQMELSTKQVITRLKDYISEKQKEVHYCFRHNYIGNIYISLKDGFQVNDIEFNKKQYSIQFVSLNHIVSYLVQSCSQLGKNEVYLIDPKDKILKGFPSSKMGNTFKKAIFELKSETNKDKLIEFIETVKRICKQTPIDYTVKLMDYRKKVPRSKVLLHFFAGRWIAKNIMFMSYQTLNSYNPAKEMLNLLQPIVEDLHGYSSLSEKKKKYPQLKMKTEEFQLNPYKMKLSKNQNGINFFETQCDQYEMREYLFDLVKANVLDFRFKFPRGITKFRHPQASQASKRDDTWRKQIVAILDKNGIPNKDIVINVRGTYIPPKGQKMGALERTFRVDMTAQLLGFDEYFISKLKTAIDGKKGILGCEKTHVRAYYDQVMAIPTTRLFQGLEQQYEYQLSIFREEFPLLYFETAVRRFKNSQRRMIIGRSSNKEDFIKPQRILSKLYSPKFIKLEGHQFNFLDKTDQGLALLDDIQYQYKFKVYFGFERYEKQLKVYCDDGELKGIEQKIKKGIRLYHFYTEKISYRGKNLNAVLNILDAAAQQAGGNEGLAYQILFQTREVEITASYKIFQKVKNNLLILTNSEKGQCQICADTLRSPYRFINCSCVFCWHCIAEYARQFANSFELILCCPSEKCLKDKVPININDFKTLLSEEEFQKICDIKVKHFLEKNPNYKSCVLCKFCENIMDRSDPNNQTVLNCEICGRVWCSKCSKQAHFGYTCIQWQNRNQVDIKQLNKLGIKQCPQCKEGIQKNKGCNHMVCKNCQTHICWKCLKMFKTEKECYDHLVKQQGGIFDRNIELD